MHWIPLGVPQVLRALPCTPQALDPLWLSRFSARRPGCLTPVLEAPRPMDRRGGTPPTPSGLHRGWGTRAIRSSWSQIFFFPSRLQANQLHHLCDSPPPAKRLTESACSRNPAALVLKYYQNRSPTSHEQSDHHGQVEAQPRRHRPPPRPHRQAGQAALGP